MTVHVDKLIAMQKGGLKLLVVWERYWENSLTLGGEGERERVMSMHKLILPLETYLLYSYKKKNSHYPDPTNAHLSPDRHFGSIPEMVMDQINSFISKNRHMLGSEEE